MGSGQVFAKRIEKIYPSSVINIDLIELFI